MNFGQRVIMIWCNCQCVTCNKSSLFALKLKTLLEKKEKKDLQLCSNIHL